MRTADKPSDGPDPNHAIEDSEKTMEADKHIRPTLFANHVHIQNAMDSDWQNILVPVVFGACLNIVFTGRHLSDWLVVCAGYIEAVPESTP